MTLPAIRSIRIPFGILGEYNAAGNTFGIGVAGISTTGYGVGAESLSTQPAMLGLNNGGGNGLEAYTNSSSATQSAIYAENTGGGAAIDAVGDARDGVDATARSYGEAGLSGENDASQGGYGVLGFVSTNGLAVEGLAVNGTGVLAEGESGDTDVPALQAFSATSGTELFDAHVYGSDQRGYTTASITFPSYDASGTIMNYVGASSDFQRVRNSRIRCRQIVTMRRHKASRVRARARK